MKEKLFGFCFIAQQFLTILSVIALFAVVTTFTHEKWDWSFIRNLFFAPVLWFLLGIPFVETILVLAILISTIVQLCSGNHGPVFASCLFFTIVGVARLACMIVVGSFMKSLENDNKNPF